MNPEILFVVVILVTIGCIWAAASFVAEAFTSIWRAGKAIMEQWKAIRQKAFDEEKAEKCKKNQKKIKEMLVELDLKYQLHEHQIKDRLPRCVFEAFVKENMNENLRPKDVEANAERMHRQIDEHIRRIDGIGRPISPEVINARVAIEDVYREYPEIHAVFPRPRLEAEIRLRLPDSITPDAAWKESRMMMDELLKLVAKGKETPKAPVASHNPPLRNI